MVYERNNIFSLKLTVKYTKMNVQYCKLQRTSTGVFPRVIRGNGLRVLVAPLRHVGVLFFRPFFVMVNYPTIVTKKQVNLIVCESGH